MSRAKMTPEEVAAHVLKAQPGFIYEPRGYWFADRQLTRPGPDSGDDVVRVGNNDEFYNGGHYPVVLTHITLDRQVSRVTAVPTPSSVLVEITSSGNQHLSRGTVPFLSLVDPEVTQEPPSAPGPGGYYTSTLRELQGFQGGPVHNVFAWDFHHPVVLPRNGAVEFSLGSRVASVVADTAADLTDVRFSVLFNETGDAGNSFFKGNARSYTGTQTRLGNKGPWGGWNPLVESVIGSPQTYPTGATISAKEYRSQNVTQAGSTALNGFRVMLDQRDLEAALRTELADPTLVFGSVGSSTPVRARTVGNGTNEFWWREGAPLSLVSPTRTNAIVGRLKTPITLQPGDGLHVTFRLPDQAQDRLNGIGVSFTGFAAIEG